MMNRELPAPVAALMRRLRAGGYTAWAVGGCVRDLLRGQQPHDWDVTTSALPPQVHEALSGVRVVDTGVSYGTVTALTDLGPVEITTYRLDGAYSDRRRPDGVAFTDRLEDDLARRDFTVNAMAWDGETLIDPFGGRRDLERGLLRAVGTPAQRFEEDALRILRALRFASTLGFDIEPETADALRSRKELLTAVAAERVREELSRLLCGHPVPVLRAYADVVAVVLPELVPTFGFNQRNRHHLYDVWEHTLHALDSAPEDAALRWALLLHDCGKPAAFSMGEDAQGHFYGHAAESARIARGTLERLRFDRAGRERILRLIALHDHDLPATPVAVRRWLLRLPPEELRLLIALKRADNAGQHPAWRHDEQWLRAAELLTEIEARDGVPSLARLAVNGQDLQTLGLRGSELGRMLDRLLEATVDGLPNERAALLAEAQRLLAK